MHYHPRFCCCDLHIGSNYHLCDDDQDLHPEPFTIALTLLSRSHPLGLLQQKTAMSRNHRKLLKEAAPSPLQKADCYNFILLTTGAAICNQLETRGP